MNYKRNQGFTLIEVMVALAVVAIVSTSLLQMFVTTTYVNKDAQLTDLANTITVQQAETFKADPLGYSHGKRYLHIYYKGNGDPIEPIPFDTTDTPDLTDIPVDIPDEAVIMVKGEWQSDSSIPTASDTGYYPDFAKIINLSDYTADLSVIINQMDTIYNGSVESAGSTTSIDTTKIKNKILPIRVDYGSRLRNIKLINNSDLEVQFYVYYTVNDSDVTFDTGQGASSVSYVRDISSSSSNIRCDLRLTAFRLSKDAANEYVGTKMLDYSANKYIHTN